MCGIVGAVAERNVTPILLEGLRRLEYRGYDSAGIAVVDGNDCLDRLRRVGKVKMLADSLEQSPLNGSTGVAHTRWATHGSPSEKNAHPHICNNSVAIVHNGIIENHGELRKAQEQQGFAFTSDTDTEVAVHQIEYYLRENDGDLFLAVQKAVRDFEGAYALGVVSTLDKNRLIAARLGSPLVIGIGIGEYFIASDVAALLPVTRRFIFLEEGDIADIRRDSLNIFDNNGKPVEREIKESELSSDAAGKGEFRHYMLKEIHEQPMCMIDALEGRLFDGGLAENIFGVGADDSFADIEQIQIIACGTSYHAGLVARYWFESLAGVPCNVEVASEFRYRKPVIKDKTLIVTISQSGETADTLAALKALKGDLTSLTICNVPESSLIRESDLALLTRAGPEIGVASTKAFTSQLVALLLLLIAVGRKKSLSDEKASQLIKEVVTLPATFEKMLAEKGEIEDWAEEFKDVTNAIFLGRGLLYPIALEGALKLKEISYIHAEAYPAGELKHGPLALIDPEMPVVAIVSRDGMEDKIKSNLQEVLARGGQVYLFADQQLDMSDLGEHCRILSVPSVSAELAPVIHALPMQLLAYFVAVRKGTDVDQPRNLAKSVTVE